MEQFHHFRTVLRRIVKREKGAKAVFVSGFQTGVRGPKGVRDGFPRGPRDDSEK